MPFFQVVGTSAKGRKVSRKVNAESEQGARSKIVRDGVTVESIVRLPPEAATDAQLSYARSLGLQITDSPNVEQMGELISRAVESPASTWLVSRAEALGADLDKSCYLGLGYVSRQLNEVLPRDSHAASLELAFWYLQSVLKHQLKANWSSPSQSGIEDHRLFSIAATFISEEKVRKTLQREYSDPIYDYVEFGDGWGGTKSVRTTAYLFATEILGRERL